MKAGYYINKKDGRVTLFSQRDVDVLGVSLLKDWAYSDNGKSGDTIEIKTINKKIAVPEELEEAIKKIEKPKIVEEAIVSEMKKSVRAIREEANSMSNKELESLLLDERVSVRAIVEKELERRKDAHTE